MIINIKDSLFLDDNCEYVVVSKIYYEEKNYYYLLDKHNIKNMTDSPYSVSAQRNINVVPKTRAQ